MVERLLIVLGVLLLLVGAGVATGGVRWETDNYACTKKAWVKIAEPVRWWSIGRVRLYYTPVEWTCTEKAYRVSDYKTGQIPK